MFSGIIETLGIVRAQTPGRIEVVPETLFARLEIGESIAVNGVCLTVSSVSDDGFTADVMPETLQRTTLGALAGGETVNLERALRFGDRVGGHMVSGHVDATGIVTALREDANARWVTIATPEDFIDLIAEKGSIAVDGISLTVVDVFEAAFTVSLIPVTLAATSRRRLEGGDRGQPRGRPDRTLRRADARSTRPCRRVRDARARGLSPMSLATVEDAIADIRAGKFVIIVDDEDRENEGDLAIAADRITPEAVNFMATHGRGLICVPMEGWRLDELGVSAMVDDNTSRFGTAFTVTVEAIGHGVTTGISAFDRATTIRLLCDEHAKPSDFAKPGHTFPLRAAVGGVLERAGQTEAIVDLCKLAGRFPAGVICEVMRARRPHGPAPRPRRFRGRALHQDRDRRRHHRLPAAQRAARRARRDDDAANGVRHGGRPRV